MPPLLHAAAMPSRHRGMAAVDQSGGMAAALRTDRLLFISSWRPNIVVYHRGTPHMDDSLQAAATLRRRLAFVLALRQMLRDLTLFAIVWGVLALIVRTTI